MVSWESARLCSSECQFRVSNICVTLSVLCFQPFFPDALRTILLWSIFTSSMLLLVWGPMLWLHILPLVWVGLVGHGLSRNGQWKGGEKEENEKRLVGYWAESVASSDLNLYTRVFVWIVIGLLNQFYPGTAAGKSKDLLQMWIEPHSRMGSGTLHNLGMSRWSWIFGNGLSPVPLRLFSYVMTLHWHNVKGWLHCVKIGPYVWNTSKLPYLAHQWTLCISMQWLRLKGCHVVHDEWTSGEICSFQCGSSALSCG